MKIVSNGTTQKDYSMSLKHLLKIRIAMNHHNYSDKKVVELSILFLINNESKQISNDYN